VSFHQLPALKTKHPSGARGPDKRSSKKKAPAGARAFGGAGAAGGKGGVWRPHAKTIRCSVSCSDRPEIFVVSRNAGPSLSRPSLRLHAEAFQFNSLLLSRNAFQAGRANKLRGFELAFNILTIPVLALGAGPAPSRGATSDEGRHRQNTDYSKPVHRRLRITSERPKKL
jgi:hypothetical protein